MSLLICVLLVVSSFRLRKALVQTAYNKIIKRPTNLNHLYRTFYFCQPQPNIIFDISDDPVTRLTGSNRLHGGIFLWIGNGF